MSLRVKLFSIFGGLIALLVGAEVWLLRSLSASLSKEVDHVVSSVGHDVFRFVSPLPPPAGAPAPEAKVGTRRLVVSTVRVDEAGKVTKSLGTGDLPVQVIERSTEGRRLVFHGFGFDTSIPVPDAGLARAVERFRRQLLLGSLTILGIGLAVAAVVADRVSAPLVHLSRAARAVGDGALGTQVEGRAARAGGEVGEAIGAFNRMSTHLKELSDEALALRERRHLGELGDVARGLAHALRNPLHAIGLSLDELASRAAASPDAPELVESTRRQIRHVDESIRSFLALASGSGEGAGAEEALDALALVEDVALTALHGARGRVRVEVVDARTDGAPRASLRGVAAELKAVVQALVVNAVEASPEGGAVVVRVAPAELDGVTIEVEDDGPGLPEEVRSRLFTPHVTTKPSGSGMGLFIAHRIATTRYGGTLALQIREPRGTRALLTLSGRGTAGA